MTADPIDYHPLDAAVRADPYPVYAALRRTGGPYWSELLRGWVVTGYQDCRRILRDHEGFAADWRRAGEQVPDNALSIHRLDPPEHDPVYGLIEQALRPLSTPRLAQEARERTEGLLDALLDSAPSGPVDLVTRFVEPLARWFIPAAMTLPAFDPLVMDPIASAIMDAMDAGLVPEAAAPGAAARQRLSGLLREWIAAMNPTDPLRVLLDRSEQAGLPEATTVNSLRTLVVNAFSSVPGSLGNALLALARHDVRLKEYAGVPGVLDRSAAQELIRYDTPLQITTRLCVTDTEVSGAAVRRGQDLILLFGAANRDPERFPEPDRLDLERSPNPHLAFGFGAHACAGSALASLLLTEVLQAFAARGISLRLAAEPTHHRRATIRSLAALPVEVLG